MFCVECFQRQDTIREGDEGHISGLAGARSISVSPDGGTALVVSAMTGTIALFRDTTTRAPTPAPTSNGGSVNRPSDEDEWYEQYAGLLGVGAVVTTAAGSGLVWLLIAKGCCGVGVAILARRKIKVECPACEGKVDVKRKGLDDRTRCYCDVLRAKAEKEAKLDGDQSSEAEAAGAGMFHPDPRLIATCPHCKFVFCVPCGVRDKKGMFSFLFENNPEVGKEEKKLAADPSGIECGIDDSGSTPISP